ncbi:MAG: response regulator transcription factor [Candidatus Pristimantibacillus sp.]
MSRTETAEKLQQSVYATACKTIGSLHLFESWGRSFASQYNLTQREIEILALIAVYGLSNGEIAKSCFITEKTVKNHLANIMCKVETNSMRKLLALFINHVAQAKHNL